jgi:azobenzene reductase
MNIVIIAGSNRAEATSTHLVRYMSRMIEQEGHHTRLFDLFQSPLPFYSPDSSYEDHTGISELKQALLSAQAVILATPEYHGGMTGVLKNALDHLGQEHFAGKAVLSVSSSGGAVGVSSLQQVQATVRNLHGINSPEWISIGGSQRSRFQTSQDAYEITSQNIDDRIHRVLTSFMRLAQGLSAS